MGQYSGRSGVVLGVGLAVLMVLPAAADEKTKSRVVRRDPARRGGRVLPGSRARARATGLGGERRGREEACQREQAGAEQQCA